MKIALICTEMLPVPPIRGGAIQILLGGVIPYLASKYEITIYCRSDRELADRETVEGVSYIRVSADDYVVNIAKELVAARKANHHYDVIHVFNRPSNILIYKSAMPMSSFVVSLHNEMFREKKITEKLGRKSIKAVDGIMSISDYIGETIISRFPIAKSKVRTVYSGIDLKRYYPIWSEEALAIRTELRKTHGVEHNKVVLFVGRLTKSKGPDILIHSMEQVIREHPDAVLMIVGSKWFHDERIDRYGERIRELASGFGDQIRFTGFIQPKELPTIFLLGDVFVCSSQWQEPLARVHYEAMGAGLPIITTNRGGNAEIIKHNENGFVIDDYTNPQAFAESISYLFNHPHEASRLAKAGRAFVEINHGYEHVARRLELLYLDALNKSI
ncbi:glycosyl transferase [Paenibacillus crassostreae]|uniref:Glycosyl transferase n=1 Tax=Paenibacillus crassostreae TaxID=1763538 RepID=A0A167G486_9BACL|nr:glycosyl transferase [Paenibacillus crassostreae]OAB77199.1 glycosyl transferase [Paenibacillus crassostreae]